MSDPPNLYHGLVKRLAVANDRSVPTELAHRGLRAVAITRHDLREDVDGINAGVDLIRRTKGRHVAHRTGDR